MPCWAWATCTPRPGIPVCGPSDEGFCIDNLVAAAGPRCTPYSYRTHAGTEIDLLLERGGQPCMAIDIKRSTAPTLSKGFDIACADLQIEQRWVVYPGAERFPMRHGAPAIGLPDSSEPWPEAANAMGFNPHFAPRTRCWQVPFIRQRRPPGPCPWSPPLGPRPPARCG